MLSNLSFGILFYLAVVGVIVLFWSEARVRRDFIARGNKTDKEHIAELVDAMPSFDAPTPTPNIEKTCGEAILSMTWLFGIMAAPVYALWAYRNGIGSPILSLGCLIVFAVWLAQTARSLFDLAPILKRGFDKLEERGGEMSMRESLKRDMTSFAPPAGPYTWRGIARRIWNEIPHLYLVYLLMVLVFVR